MMCGFTTYDGVKNYLFNLFNSVQFCYYLNLVKTLCNLLQSWQGFYFELDSAARGQLTTDSKYPKPGVVKHSVISLLPT